MKIEEDVESVILLTRAFLCSFRRFCLVGMGKRGLPSLSQAIVVMWACSRADKEDEGGGTIETKWGNKKDRRVIQHDPEDQR